MIALTTQTASAYLLVIKDKHTSDFKDLSRRVSRIATLDGSATVNDSGYTDADRIIKIRAKITEAEWDTLQYMFENYSLWDVSTQGEFLSVAPKTLKAPNGDLTLTLLVTE